MWVLVVAQIITSEFKINVFFFNFLHFAGSFGVELYEQISKNVDKPLSFKTVGHPWNAHFFGFFAQCAILQYYSDMICTWYVDSLGQVDFRVHSKKNSLETVLLISRIS